MSLLVEWLNKKVDEPVIEVTWLLNIRHFHFAKFSFFFFSLNEMAVY